MSSKLSMTNFQKRFVVTVNETMIDIGMSRSSLLAAASRINGKGLHVKDFRAKDCIYVENARGHYEIAII